MFELKSLAAWIEDKLNIKLAEKLPSLPLLATDRYRYSFRVYPDIGEHKGYDYLDNNGERIPEKTNRIVRYIECGLSQVDSSVESVVFTNIIRNTELKILIPLNDIELLDEQNTVVSEIRDIIDETFSKNGRSVVSEDEDGTTTDYPFSVEYSLSNTGERVSRIFTGDSVMLTAYINFYYVEQGLPSENVIVAIDNMLIQPIRLGMNRSITEDTNTYSNDTRATAMNTPTSSLFNINFDMVARTDALSEMLYKFALTSKTTDKNGYLKPNVAHLVMIQYRVSPGNVIETYKLMSFNSVGVSTQLPLIASLSVTMTETKYIAGLTNLSSAAATNQNLGRILAEQG